MTVSAFDIMSEKTFAKWEVSSNIESYYYSLPIILGIIQVHMYALIMATTGGTAVMVVTIVWVQVSMQLLMEL